MADEAQRLELESVIGFNGSIPNALHRHPDGIHVVFALGSAIVIRNIEDPSKQRFLQAHTDTVSCVKLSKDGKYIASGQYINQGFQAKIVVTEFETGETVHEFLLHKVKIQDLSFSFDAKYLASIGGVEDRRLVVWDLSTGKAVAGTLVTNESIGLDTVNCVSFFNKRNDRIITAGYEKIIVWEMDYELKTIDSTPVNLAQLKRDIVSVCVSDDDKAMYCGTSTGDILEINLQTRLFKQSTPGRAGLLALGVTALMLEDDGDVMFGTGKGTIGVLQNMQIAYTLPKPVNGGVTSLTRCGKEVYVGTTNSTIYKLTLGKYVPEIVSIAPRVSVKQVVYSEGYSEVFATCSENTITIWKVDGGAELLKISEKNADCLCLVFSPDGKQIVSGWSDGRIRSYGPQSGKKLYTIENAHDKVTAIAVTHDSTHIISGGSEGMVRAWRVAQNYQKLSASMKEHKSQVSAIKIRKNDAECVSAAGDGSCIIWDMSRFTRSQTLLMPNFFRDVAYLPDESQVVTTGSDRKIVYWDPYDGAQLRELEGSLSAELNTLSISVSGKFIASGGGDRLLKIWDYDEGTIRAIGLGHAAGINSVAFSPDGQKLVSVSQDGGIFIWASLNEDLD